MENKDEHPKPPKRKKAAPKKIVASFTADQIQKMLKDALLKNASERLKQSDLEIEAMVATMEEFLRSFIVIGYNLNNQPIVITNAKSQLDADALYTSLARLFISMNHHNGL